MSDIFTAEQHDFLLLLAREAITIAVREQQIIQPLFDDDAYQQPLGAFTTLKIHGKLRGCIGFPEAQFPIGETVVQTAISAALKDPRFPPLNEKELGNLQIEISVLSPLVKTTVDEIEVGVHGLVLEKGKSRGLLLPQVPLEWGWDKAEYLANLSQKAGLPADGWKTATLYRFTAEVFSEDK